MSNSYDPFEDFDPFEIEEPVIEPEISSDVFDKSIEDANPESPELIITAQQTSKFKAYILSQVTGELSNTNSLMRFVSRRDISGLIFYLKQNLGLGNDNIHAALTLLGLNIPNYDFLLKDEVDDNTFEFVRQRLQATDDEITVLMDIFTTPLTFFSDLKQFYPVMYRDYVRVFKKLSGYKLFPAALFRALIDKVLAMENQLRESEKSGKTDNPIPITLVDPKAEEKVVQIPNTESVKAADTPTDSRSVWQITPVLSEGNVMEVSGKFYRLVDGQWVEIDSGELES